MLHKHKRYTAIEGFTLIELSIVLVVIGLIVGGILVGKQLIAASEVRAQISQFEKYKSAVSTFVTKYKDLPGDIGPAKAAQFGLTPRAGTVGQGDADGLIEGGGTGYTEEAGEDVTFWNDLSTANLIVGHFIGNDCPPNAGLCLATSATVPVSYIIPPAPLGSNTYIIVYGIGGLNYFTLVPFEPSTLNPAIATSGTTCCWTPNRPTPSEAYSIDTKIDDGYPLTGQIIITGGFSVQPWTPPPATPAAPAPGVCVANTATPTYNVAGTANADSFADCIMRVAF
jgi:prepilin-type N-terminal cleavage/methylation domain-containing protein